MMMISPVMSWVGMLGSRLKISYSSLPTVLLDFCHFCCCIAPVVWANWTLTTRVIAHESRAGRLRGEGGSALEVDQGPVFISWGMMGDR